MGRKFWEIRAAAEPGVGELLLYGLIGPDDGFGFLFDQVTPKQFRDDLDSLGVISDLNVFINSEGGDVFAGQAIHSMLQRHPANVNVYVDGLAASIASVVAMAGDRVIMPSNAMMMVHNPWTISAGDSEEFRKIADTLDNIRESMIAAYQSKTGMARDELVPLLEAETWMSAEEAVDRGFADEIEETKRIAASMRGPDRIVVQGREMDLSAYRNRPKNIPQKTSSSQANFDEQRSQCIELTNLVVTGWENIAAKAKTLSVPRRQRLDADVSALEDASSSLRELLTVADDDGANSEDLKVRAEVEIMRARLQEASV